MRYFPKSAKWRGVCCGLILGAAVVYWFYDTSKVRRIVDWVRRGMPTGDAYIVDVYRDSTDPYFRDLARGEIRAGDSFDELVSKYQPSTVVKHEEYRTAYFPGGCLHGSSRVMAKHGRLVFADQDFGDHRYTYFNILTPHELEAAEESCHTAKQIAHRRWTVSSAAVLGVAPLVRRSNAESFPPHDDRP